MKNINKLNALIKEYQEMRALVNDAKAAQDNIAGQIKSLMESEELEEYVSPTGKAIYREVVSHPLDTALFKRELPHIADMYTAERVSRPLKIA